MATGMGVSSSSCTTTSGAAAAVAGATPSAGGRGGWEAEACGKEMQGRRSQSDHTKQRAANACSHCGNLTWSSSCTASLPTHHPPHLPAGNRHRAGCRRRRRRGGHRCCCAVLHGTAAAGQGGIILLLQGQRAGRRRRRRAVAAPRLLVGAGRGRCASGQPLALDEHKADEGGCTW